MNTELVSLTSSSFSLDCMCLEACSVEGLDLAQTNLKEVCKLKRTLYSSEGTTNHTTRQRQVDKSQQTEANLDKESP